jgi:heptosyltransferase II
VEWFGETAPSCDREDGTILATAGNRTAEEHRRILLVKYRGLGDAVIGLGALQYLRELAPRSTIFYGVPAWVAPLFTKTRTAADGVIPLSLKTPAGWLALARWLRAEKIDLVYELFRSGRTGTFFSRLAGPLRFDYRFHNHHLREGTQIVDQGVIKPVIQRDLDGIYSLLSDRRERPHFHRYSPRLEVAPAMAGDYVILGVVATRETKCWPLDSFVALARQLAEAYPTMAIRVPLSSSARDREIEEELRSHPLPAQLEFLRLPLAEIPGLIAGARLYVGNDTGLKHVAVAVGVRTITFFGPEPPLEWHPYRRDEHRYFYREQLACRTVKNHFCELTTCASMACMREFGAGAVFSLVKEALTQ